MKTGSVIRIVPHEEIYTEAALEVIIELYPKVAERLFKSRTPAAVQTPVAVGDRTVTVDPKVVESVKSTEETKSVPLVPPGFTPGVAPSPTPPPDGFSEDSKSPVRTTEGVGS